MDILSDPLDFSCYPKARDPLFGASSFGSTSETDSETGNSASSASSAEGRYEVVVTDESSEGSDENHEVLLRRMRQHLRRNAAPEDAEAGSLLSQVESALGRVLAKKIERERKDEAKASAPWLVEPITQGDKTRRFVMDTSQYSQFIENFCDQTNQFWKFREIDFGNDRRHFETLDPDVQHYLKGIMCFFACADSAVISNISLRFLREIKVTPIILPITSQLYFESQHHKTYDLMIRAIIPYDEIETVTRSYLNMPVVKAKIDWITRRAEQLDSPLHLPVVGQCIAEGVLFASSFVSFLWLRQKELCPGICEANEFILKDECQHVKLFSLIYKECVNKVTQAEIEEIVAEAVQLEDNFVDACLPRALTGVNATMMKEYVRNVADVVLTNLGFDKMYHARNPFPWMKTAALIALDNFFEKKVTDYQQPGQETLRTQVFQDLGAELDF